MIDTKKLEPVLRKEPILKTANARELRDTPQEVLQRYQEYALTHVPLGDTTKQMRDLERVIVEHKHCAVGAIVGPYGYGKTSTAVHLWNELRERKIAAIPPFLWVNLSELMDAVYYWLHFEFSLGPKEYVETLEELYERYRRSHREEIFQKIDPELAQSLIDRGTLILEIRPDDVIHFFADACELSQRAGYKGMVIFTDELQQTLAQYKPSRDEFFAHIFQIVKDVQDMVGNWALVMSMDDDTQSTIARLRRDIQDRMQRSALYFRVRDMYNRREYPTELWEAFEKRFDFDGGEIINRYTLDSIGQIASRSDLGAGPRMVTLALALAVKNYEKTGKVYTPLQFVDDFLEGLVTIDPQGKFATAVKRALENDQVRGAANYQAVVKLLAAYPMGCAEEILRTFGYLEAYQAFPPVARRELIMTLSGGPTLRSLAADATLSESLVQRLTTEFASRFSPNKQYAKRAADGFITQIIEGQVFNGWKKDKEREIDFNGMKYQARIFQGGFDNNYPDRVVAVLVSAMPGSPTPVWKKAISEAEIELRFELNYAILPTEPSRLVVSTEKPDVAVFQLNISAVNVVQANKIVPRVLFDYYPPERWSPFLCLSLIGYLLQNMGEKPSPDELNRINAVIHPLRQYTLQILLSEQLETVPDSFGSGMVGVERIKNLVRKQCQQLYPHYKTLMTNSKWKENLQQYRSAIQHLIQKGEISIVRGSRPFNTTKEEVADVFMIPGRRLTNIEPLLDNLKELIIREEFSGRSATSAVRLRFKLHPLEEDLLGQIDGSSEYVKRNGLEVPSIPADMLLRYARKQGYREPEIVEILYLLRDRALVDWDQKKNLLVRTVDTLDDLRDALREQLKTLEMQIHALADALPDFDTHEYPLSKLRTQVEEAKERDDLENVKADIRDLQTKIRSFSSSRTHVYREKLRSERDRLHGYIRDGLPPWLRNPFEKSPLQDLLEKQRTGIAIEYQNVLDDIRALLDSLNTSAGSSQGNAVEELITTYNTLMELLKQSKKLITRLESYQDRKEDFDAWRVVSKKAAEVNQAASNIQDVYNDAQFKTGVEQLWASLRSRFESQPLSFLSSHRAMGKEIEVERQRLNRWLEGRREDFEAQCQAYREILADVQIKTDLRIPFDSEHPVESQSVLFAQVRNSLNSRLNVLLNKMKGALQVIRYAIQVQGVRLSDAEQQAKAVLQRTSQLRASLTDELIANQAMLKQEILQPLASLIEEEARLEREVRQATQQLPAEGSELVLIEFIRNSGTNQEIDLRELIIRLLDQQEDKGAVNLGELMGNLESLFQKNLVDIRIRLRATK